MDSDKKQQLDTLITHVTGATTSSSVTNAQVAKMCQLLEELLSAEETRSIAAEAALNVVASVSDNGLMSSVDKTKLDGIESNAQKNPGVATTSSNGLMSASDKVNLGKAILATASAGIDKDDTTNTINLYDVNEEYALEIKLKQAVAGSSAGLMSGTDKNKLDAYETLFADDYTIRHGGITVSGVSRSATKIIGNIHVKTGEKFQVTNNSETQTALTISSAQGIYRSDELYVQGGETDTAAINDTLYDQFSIDDSFSEDESEILVKIV